LGLAAARNTALRHTDADVLVFVDADAYADADMLAALLPEFARHEDVVGVGGQGVEAVQETIYDRWRALHASQGYGPRRRERCDHLFGLCMAYRRAPLLAMRGFNVLFRSNAEDVDVGLRLNAAGYRLVYTPRARVSHQRRDDHASLRRAMYQWYYWAFLAKRMNGRWPWSLAAGTLRRLFWSDTWPDLLERRDGALLLLDVEMAIIKMQALLAADRSPVLDRSAVPVRA
jgi:cellulose synthase/poly-beta-1,6-N-acetylglucosamine synthase-like glycosyltransferase